MTVSALVTRNDITATASQTSFTYTFRVLEATDMDVYQNGALLASGYTVNDVGSTTGGTVVLDTGALTGQIVSLVLAMPLDRTTNYQNSGDFLAGDVNGDFDKIYIGAIQNENEGGRSLRLQDVEPPTAGVDMTIPLKANRLGKFLGFNSITGAPQAMTGEGATSSDLVSYTPAGTGAVETNVQAKLRETVSVEDFGGTENIVGQLHYCADVTNGSTITLISYHSGINSGGGIFHWDSSRNKALHDGGIIIDPDITFPTDWSNATQVATWFTAGTGSGCWVRQYDGAVDVAWFGAIDGVSSATVNASGTSVTLSAGSFTSADIGKAIQVFGAGTTGGLGDFSHSSLIISIAGSVATIGNTVGNAVTSVSCYYGFDNSASFINALEYSRVNSTDALTATGSYLISASTGDITTQQIVYLQSSNIFYDFSGLNLYGMMILVDNSSGSSKQVADVKLDGITIHCLGDTLDALAGAVNWNGLGVAEGVGVQISNISVYMGSGCRAFSFQTNNLDGGVQSASLTNFYFYANVGAGLKCDGIDITAVATSGVDIQDIHVSNGIMSNLGRPIIASNGSVGGYLQSLNISNITCTGSSYFGVVFSRVQNSSITNISLDTIIYSASVAGSGRPLQITTAKDIECSYVNMKDAIAGDIGITVSGLSATLDNNILIKNVNITGTAYTQGISFGAHGLIIDNCLFEHCTTAIYTLGFRGLVQNCKFKTNTLNFRSGYETSIEVDNNWEITDANLPAQLSEGGKRVHASVVFNGVGTDGTDMTILDSYNVSRVARTSTGLYTVYFTNKAIGYVGVAGGGRLYAGLYGQVSLTSATGANAASMIIANVAGATVNESDQISAIFA